MIEQILVSLIILWSAWKIVEAVDYNNKVINKEGI
jgi:hypothetical protein